jgi:two-component system CheB/CheR fusion protein
MISVRGFLREREALEVLATRVLPGLVERAAAGEPVRVWVPGCATGEEAYSIAMMLIEQFNAAKKRANLQVFATDIDQETLEVARQGVYADGIVSDVSPKRLRRFFVRTDERHYRVHKRLRDCVVFAPQNLINDAPLPKLDLISCRNLLIYLEPDVQQKAIMLFHFALSKDGYLLLGPSESIGRSTELFEPISRKWRAYRRIDAARRKLTEIPIVTGQDRRAALRRPHVPHTPASGFKELMEKLVLEECAPASALINSKYEILCAIGPLVDYLEFPQSELSNDLLSRARQGLRAKIRAACRAASERNERISDAGLRVKRNGRFVPCSIAVRPVPEFKAGEGLLLVTFRDRAGEDRTEELQRLAAQLMDHQEGATRHIARELHDGFGQELAALDIDLSRLEKEAAGTPDKAATIRKLRGRIAALASGVHQLSRQLHPVVLHDLGLVAGLKALVDTFQARFGILTKCAFGEIPAQVPQDAQLCVYRIARECLNNVGRHSNAAETLVTLGLEGDTLVLSVADNGDGFDPEAARRSGGLGLISMTERATLAGGSLAVESSRGNGTEVKACIPFHPHDEAV